MFFACGVPASAQDDQQQQLSPEEQAKKLQEFITTQVEKMTEDYNLNDAQVFYVDSTLNHDYKAMQAEMMDLSSSKVSNYNIYTSTQDKWMQRIDDSYQRIMTPDQWARYLKSGAERDQKARAKRMEKAGLATAALQNAASEKVNAATANTSKALTKAEKKAQAQALKAENKANKAVMKQKAKALQAARKIERQKTRKLKWNERVLDASK